MFRFKSFRIHFITFECLYRNEMKSQFFFFKIQPLPEYMNFFSLKLNCSFIDFYFPSFFLCFWQTDRHDDLT